MGTLLLIEVGHQGSLAAIPAASVVAHGEAQFWGFVAPFIVGVAASFLTMLVLGVGQRLLPILGHDLLACPRLVVPILVLIAVGEGFDPKALVARIESLLGAHAASGGPNSSDARPSGKLP